MEITQPLPTAQTMSTVVLCQLRDGMSSGIGNILGNETTMRDVVGLLSKIGANGTDTQMTGSKKLQILDANCNASCLRINSRGLQLYTPLTSAMILDDGVNNQLGVCKVFSDSYQQHVRSLSRQSVFA